MASRRATRVNRGETCLEAGASAQQGGVCFKLLVFLVVIVAFAALGWMLFLPFLVTKQIRARTGFDATVASLAVNPLSGTVQLRGFLLANPPTFPVRDFLDVREFRANAKVRTLFGEQMVFDTMTVDIASITLVKRQDGTTNAQAFEENLKQADGRHALTRVEKSRKYLIRDLRLRIDRLVVEDHSLRRPSSREFTLGLVQNYTDVTSMEQLLTPAALKPLAPVALAISGFVPGDLGKALEQATKSGTELLKQAGRKTTEAIKGFFDALEESKKP